MTENKLSDIIKQLRSQEELILHDYEINYEVNDLEGLQLYLKDEYLMECQEYPENPPEFSMDSAVWAAKLVFRLAHFVLYREQSEEELENPFVPFKNNPSASEMMSADLCLRFVPILRKQLENINREDVLIEKLDNILIDWPYSTVKNLESVDSKAVKVITENECLKILMVNRIVECKNMKLAKLDGFSATVKSYLSIFTGDYWPEYGEKY